MDMDVHQLIPIFIDYHLWVNFILLKLMLVCELFHCIHCLLILKFYFYLAITEISPNNGSINGGTMLTINGNYFSDSSRYPLSVNIDDEPCIILSTNLTTIQCQTLASSTVNRSHYHGKFLIE